MQKEIYSFIGMSGIGKSHWSSRLKDMGFVIYSIDDIINDKLKDTVSKFEIKNNINYRKSKVGDLAKWMGFPDDERYPKNAKKYLETETKVMKEVLNKIKKSKEKVVIDTTGSVIYIDKDILKRLKSETKIIYFESGKSHLKEMFEKFKNEPRPIIWNNFYTHKKGEDENKALARCYKELLLSRAEKYNKLTKNKIKFKWQFDKKRTVEDIYKKISSRRK